MIGEPGFENRAKIVLKALVWLGLALVLLSIAADRLGVGREGGFGPTQTGLLISGIFLSVASGWLLRSGRRREWLLQHLRVIAELLAQLPSLTFPRQVVLTGYVAAVGLLGLLPHIMFSLHVHEISYFKYAYDEEFYSNLALEPSIVPGRIVSGAFFRILYFLCGHNLELSLILSDFLLPCACAVAAVYAAGCLSKQIGEQLVIATLLLFGQELLSLGCSAVWPDGSFNIVSVRRALGSWGAVLIPNSYTSYFALFRTPEPQASWPFVFLFLGFSYRLFTRGQAAVKAKEKLAFVFLCVLASLGYVYCSFAILLFILSLTLRAVIFGPKAQISTFVLGLAIAGFLFLAPVAEISRSGSGLYSTHGLFQSRLPSMGVSVFAGLLLLYLAWVLSQRLGWKDRKVHFLIVSASLPIMLMDQQVISGVMVLTRGWERYINYQLLVFGAAIGASLYGLIGSDMRRRMGMQPLALFLLLVFLSYLVVHAQNRTYGMWLSMNEVSTAQKRAVEDALKRSPSVRRIVVEDPRGAALLSIRLGREFEILAEYGGLFTEPIADMPAEGSAPAGREPHLRRLFEYLARAGKTPEWLSSTLQEEVETAEGFYLGFLFSFKDFWGPISDYRAVRRDEIMRQIPGLVDSYKGYLQTLREGTNEPALYLTSSEIKDAGGTGYWQYTLLSKGQISTAAPPVWAYLQSPRPHAP
jgi:hypothetical protein